MKYCILLLPWILAAPLYAQDDYERAIRSRRHTEKGKELTRIGDVKGAIMDFDEAIRLDADNAEAYLSRGRAKAKRKDFDGALNDYSQAIETNPEHPLAYYERSQSHVEKEDWESALEDLTEAIKLDSSNPDYYRSRAAIRLNRHQHTEAVEDFERLANLEKNDLRHLRSLSDAKYAAGDFEGALEVCNSLLRKNRRSASGYVLRARLKIIKGLGKGAHADYDRAVKYSPQSPEPYFSRGLFFYARNQFSKARNDLSAGLELTIQRESLDYANLWLWMTDARMGKVVRADETLRRYRDEREEEKTFDWPDTITRFVLGEISEEKLLVLAKDTDLIKEKEQVAEANYYAAQTHILENRWEEALKRLKTCVAANILLFYEHTAAFLQISHENDIQRRENSLRQSTKLGYE